MYKKNILKKKMAEIVAEKATFQDQDSNIDEAIEDDYFEEGLEDDEDMDEDDHNAASFLEVTLDPKQYVRSSDTQEDESDEDDYQDNQNFEHIMQSE